MKSIPPEDQSDFGFQIAPMIDVVFVIMLFFMVMAGAIKVENHLVTNLPGRADSESADFVDETIINGAEDGEKLSIEIARCKAKIRTAILLDNRANIGGFQLRHGPEQASGTMIIGGER